MATTAPQAPEPTLADAAAEDKRLRAAVLLAENERALEQQTATADVLRAISTTGAIWRRGAAKSPTTTT